MKRKRITNKVLMDEMWKLLVKQASDRETILLALQQNQNSLNHQLGQILHEMSQQRDALAFQLGTLQNDLSRIWKKLNEATPEKLKEVLAQIKQTYLTYPPVTPTGMSQKILTIKEIRELTGMGLKEAKDLVESWDPERSMIPKNEALKKLKEKFFDDKCTYFIATIKEHRELTGMSLRESKEEVESWARIAAACEHIGGVVGSRCPNCSKEVGT